MQSLIRGRVLKFAVTCAVVVCSGTAFAQNQEARYLDGLRSRGFFTLAEKYCRDEFAAEDQSPRRATLVMELSRTLVEHGKFQSNAEREAMWQQADKTLFEGSGVIPEADLKVRLDAQGAVNAAHQATFLRWQSEVAPQDSLLKELTLVKIERAQKVLASAVNRVQSVGSSDAFSKRSLLTTLNLHQARALMDQAKLLPPESAERTSVVSQAEAIVSRVSSMAIDDQVRIDARVLYAECCRERGDGRRAKSLLDNALKLSTDDNDRDRILAERIRVLLYEQRPDEATKQIITWRQQRGSLSGELHVLRMQSLIALWQVARIAKDRRLATELIKQMETSAQYAKQEVSGYWSFRCDRLLAATRETEMLGSALANLKRKAEQDHREGNVAAAAKNFGLAAAEALAEDKQDVATKLYYQQGSLLVQEQELAAAAIAFRQAAGAGTVETGADAHLMHTWCLGRLYQGRSTQSRREAYTAALKEHRNIYQMGTTQIEATFMLASLEESRLQNSKAIDLYKQVLDRKSPRYAQSSAAIARCYGKVLSRLKSIGNQPLFDEWMPRAVADLAPRIADLPNPPEPLNLDQAELAVQVASIMLQQAKPDYKRAGSLLQRGITDVEALEPSPRTKQLIAVAERWRLITAVATGQTADAARVADTLQNRSGKELFALIESFDEISGGNQQSRPQLVALRLRVGELCVAKKKELTPKQQARLTAWMIGTYFDNGKRTEALEQAAKAIETSKDPLTLSKVSALVQTLRAKDAQTLARRGWKKLETQSKAGSSTWLNARLHVAECTLELGDAAECRKLLRITRLLYPELGGPQLKAAFDSFQARVP